jgi:hypothetical protein
MEIGMLWHDSDQHRDLAGKVRRAARHYTKKYGKEPDICFIHPQTLGQEPSLGARRGAGKNGLTIDRISIQRSEQVLPHHFWIGVSGS